MSLKNNEDPVASIITKLMQDSKNLASHHEHLRDTRPIVDSARLKDESQHYSSFIKRNAKRREFEAARIAVIRRENASLVERLLYHASRNEWSDRLFAGDEFAKDHPKTLNLPARIEEGREINLENERMLRRLQERASRSDYAQGVCRPKFLHPPHLFKNKNRTALPRIHREKMRALNVSDPRSTPKVHSLTLRMNRVKSKIDYRRPRTEIPRARTSLRGLLNEFAEAHAEDLAPFLKDGRPQTCPAEMQKAMVDQTYNQAYIPGSSISSSGRSPTYVTESQFLDAFSNLSTSHSQSDRADSDVALIFDNEDDGINSSSNQSTGRSWEFSESTPLNQQPSSHQEHTGNVPFSPMAFSKNQRERCKSAPATGGYNDNPLDLPPSDFGDSESMLHSHTSWSRRKSDPTEQTTFRKCPCCGQMDPEEPEICRLCSQELSNKDLQPMKNATTGEGYTTERCSAKETALQVQERYLRASIPRRPRSTNQSKRPSPTGTPTRFQNDTLYNAILPSRPPSKKFQGPARPGFSKRVIRHGRHASIGI